MLMNLMSALFDTYEFAQTNDLVDNHSLAEKGQVLVPIFHSSRKSNGNDVFEITIDEKGNAIGGCFLEKDEIVIFPVTEDSITRSGAKIAPHAICDELSYLAEEIDVKKNEEYHKGIKELLEYEKEKGLCKNFEIIGKYICRNEILDDFLRFFVKDCEYSIDDKYVLKYKIEEAADKVKEKSINLSKIFITFKIEKLYSADISVTRDVGLHNFYIDYVKEMNQSERNLRQCSATGQKDYCIERHRGVIGNAKLISISNNNETYYGRIKKGKDIFSLSYSASQKIHNMLKYLLDNETYRRFIGGDAYVVNWLAHDLEKGGFELISKWNFADDEIEELTMSELGGEVSNLLGDYFLGKNRQFAAKNDFYVLIVEKISNGRVSIKYFRRLTRSEAYERVKNWYESVSWKLYNKHWVPSLYEIVNFLYGEENSKGYLTCENKKLVRSTIERLLPCVIDSKKLPGDIARLAFNKLSNKHSYKKAWQKALSIGCALIKKHKYDYEGYNLNPDKISEVKKVKSSRDFNYGKLMAIYERVELAALLGRDGEDLKKERGKNLRITNADRLWSAMIRTPERTRFILESKIKPYMNILKKSKPGMYVFFDKMITEITLKLIELDDIQTGDKGALNEEFVLGYYYQKNEFYKKRDKKNEESE